MGVAGLLLAAGAGVRHGGPKALVRDPSGETWVRRTALNLSAAGCDPVFVTVGAAASEVAAAVGDAAVVVPVDDWAEGMGASLRAGLAAVAAGGSGAALVMLVDLPDVGADVLRRVLAAGGDDPDVLARAAYAGVPGHPVLLGGTHLAEAAGAATGDRGARDFLAGVQVRLVECGDLAGGEDQDR